MSPYLNVVEHTENGWRDVQMDIDAVVAAVFATIKESWDNKAIAVVLSDDVHIRPLNCDFRGKDAPTNVLSFPSDESEEWGDVIISIDTVAREAGEQGKLVHDHAVHMLVHGVLHLVGYDHIDDVDAEIMEALEIAVLDKVGIENPYENG